MTQFKIFLINPQGQTIEIKDELILGRPDFPEDKKISRQHCRLSFKHNEVRIMDLNSSNKTLVDDYVLPPHFDVILKGGEEIKIGEQIFKLHFHDITTGKELTEQQRRDAFPTIELDDITKAGLELDRKVLPGRQKVTLDKLKKK